jgi:hypothetical protein
VQGITPGRHRGGDSTLHLYCSAVRVVRNPGVFDAWLGRPPHRVESRPCIACSWRGHRTNGSTTPVLVLGPGNDSRSTVATIAYARSCSRCDPPAFDHTRCPRRPKLTVQVTVWKRRWFLATTP